LNSRGVLITLEGIDGTGKSTQLRRLVRHLRQEGYPVRATREPGGTPAGEKVRAILMSEKEDLSALTELALFYAARAQHVVDVIRPALERGEVVISDRYNDCSFVYQGYARGLGARTVRLLDRAICGPTQPDLTLVLDLDPRLALERALGRDAKSGSSRFEAAGLEFQKRARAAYLGLARREPRRVKVIDAGRTSRQVAADIHRLVDEELGRRRRKSGNRNRRPHT
jgi:dTMP kinase